MIAFTPVDAARGETAASTSGPDSVPLTAAELNRLRWRCRRGLLENDLVLARFLDARGARLTREEIGALDQLLRLADATLWDLLCGRSEPEDETLRPVLHALRNA